jgi:hypothetical protein
MINYDPTKSLFFDSNKKYCEEIETKLKTMNIDCSGFCNCYGYDIDAVLIKDNFTYNIKYHKHQTTQNGIVIPVDAIDYAGVELTVTPSSWICPSLNKQKVLSGWWVPRLRD